MTRQGDVDQVDQGATGSQLREPELGQLPLQGAAENITVETSQAPQIARAQDDVVDLADVDRRAT